MSQTREICLYALLAVLIGTAASVAANLFVQGGAIFIWLSEILRSVVSAASFDYAPLVQALCLFIGALLIYQIRRRFGVTKWSGPAESMFALQYRAGPPLNTRIGAGSVFAAFVACGCGAPGGQHLFCGAPRARGRRSLSCCEGSLPLVRESCVNYMRSLPRRREDV